ncbi:hypothetical protein ACSBR2_027605 [Camellia fascicularis]
MAKLAVVAFDDQTILLLPSKSTRFPSSPSPKTPWEFLARLSLLATHITVCSEIVLYYMPRHLFVELPGLKKPNTKFPPAEVKVWLMLIDSLALTLSSLARTGKIKEDNIIILSRKQQAI